jgi:glycosyltransferase involved in cell wall biosynthesis
MQRIERVLFLAAHGGFAGQAVPLGGGAAVANMLEAEWGRTRPFELQMVGPAALGSDGPSAKDIVRFNEREYAAFCNRFRNACTERALNEDPARTAILVNDIAEGPDFARLSAAGFRIVTLYHVDVVAYIASIYLRGLLEPWTLARTWERLRALLAPLAPSILKLIFEQQRDSLLYSEAVLVPSAPMKETLLRSYGGTTPERVRVLPWGALPDPFEPDAVRAEADSLRGEYDLPEGTLVLLCLSRISPEKGQDLLLRALRCVEDRLPCPVALFVCGEKAFMMGDSFGNRLRRLAAECRRARVIFPGYVTGLRKRAFFELADLYAFPSRHESYGLTLVEALAAGCPALTLDHAGARQIMRPKFGRVVERAGEEETTQRLGEALVELCSDRARLSSMGEAGARWAGDHPFSESARELASVLCATRVRS